MEDKTKENDDKIDEDSIIVWRNIRQTGRLTCHRVSIPTKCMTGECDLYPIVELCNICNPCPCHKIKKSKFK